MFLYKLLYVCSIMLPIAQFSSHLFYRVLYKLYCSHFDELPMLPLLFGK